MKEVMMLELFTNRKNYTEIWKVQRQHSKMVSKQAKNKLTLKDVRDFISLLEDAEINIAIKMSFIENHLRDIDIAKLVRVKLEAETYTSYWVSAMYPLNVLFVRTVQQRKMLALSIRPSKSGLNDSNSRNDLLIQAKYIFNYDLSGHTIPASIWINITRMQNNIQTIIEDGSTDIFGEAILLITAGAFNIAFPASMIIGNVLGVDVKASNDGTVDLEDSEEFETFKSVIENGDFTLDVIRWLAIAEANFVNDHPEGINEATVLILEWMLNEMQAIHKEARAPEILQKAIDAAKEKLNASNMEGKSKLDLPKNVVRFTKSDNKK